MNRQNPNWKGFFKITLTLRIQDTILGMFKLGFITWIVGTVLMVKQIIPCNGATEYAIFTASLIFSVGMTKKILGDKI